MQAYKGPTGDILVNFSQAHDLEVGSAELVAKCKDAIDILVNYPKKIPLSADVDEAILLLIESGSCLQAEFFLAGPGLNIHNSIAEKFVTWSPLGKSIVEALTPFGLFAAVEKRRGGWRPHLRSRFYKVIAALTMMIDGADNIDQLSKELLIDLISYFRTPDGLRWRSGFLNSEDVAVTCFREFTRALGGYFKDNELLAKAAQTRIESSIYREPWRMFRSRLSPMRRDLLRYYDSYSKLSISRPDVDRRVIIDLDTVLTSLGHVSLSEACQKPFPPNALLQLYQSRTSTLKQSALDAVRQARRFSEFLVSEMSETCPGTTFFPIVTEKEAAYAANMVGDRPGKHSEAAARAVAERFHFLAKQILAEGVDGWPGLTFTCETLVDGETKRIYCPVLPTLLSAMFEIPLRAVQFRRLDSGEGDLRRFNGRKMEWEPNNSPNAGYWQQRGHASSDETRGYAYEFKETSPTITGLYVNTNKTGKPYTIPWMSPEIHLLLWELAEWQLKYNPVEGPVGPDDYLDDELPEVTRNSLPAIFALFRMPPSSKKPVPGIPPSASTLYKAFLALMLEVERRWNDLNPMDRVTIITRYGPTGQPQRCAYTLHGLRVRGITNLHRAGVPLEIISKMVAGHATVVMTLYYLKFEPAQVHEMLSSAMVNANSTEVTSFINELKNMKVAEARRRTTYVEESAIAQIETADKNLFCNVDIGVCPYDGSRCHDGGEVIRVDNTKGTTDKNAYGPVRGGSRNCIMCRHFVSGTPFVFQLELFGSALLWKRNDLSRQQNEHRARLQALYAGRDTGDTPKEVFRTMADRLRAENTTLKNEIEDVDEAIFRVNVHLKAASRIIKDDLGAGLRPTVALVANDVPSAIGYVERTQFDTATILSSATRFWSILKDDSLEKAKRHFIDQIMWRADQVPLTFRADLTEEQRQAASDLIGQFLMQRVSSADRRALVDGSSNLADLRIDKQVQELLDDLAFKEIPVSRSAPVTAVAHIEG